MKANSKQSKLLLGILAIIHVVGLLGLQFSFSRPVFEDLTPMTVLLGLGIVFWFHQDWSPRFVLACILVFSLGYAIEVVGVSTGFPFGEYRYKQHLGPKLFEVPLLIGLNWLLLVYGAFNIVHYFLQHNAERVNRALLPLMHGLGVAFLLVAIDLVIEPFAIHHKLWQWGSGHPPLENYQAWGAVAFVMGAIMSCLAPHRINKAAIGVFLILLLFFGFHWLMLEIF